MTCSPTDSDATGGPAFDPARIGSGGWRRWAFPGIWLIYLVQVADGVGKHASGIGATVGYTIIGLYAVTYLAAVRSAWEDGSRRVWAFYGLGFALTAAELCFAHEDAFVFLTYQAVLTVACVRRYKLAVVVAMAALAFLVPAMFRTWGGLGYSNALSVLLVALAMYGFFGIIRANHALAAARTEIARLAAENERSRIARDLHDLLGHSLTTITVKAALARRLAERDPQRAAEEIAAVEQLSRRALGEVRAAVAGYRDVTLAGELASAREVLHAAGIRADLPRAVDTVDPDAAEPFGWVVREAVTNVVRHSRATRCVITVGPRWVEIADDGCGPAPSTRAGNGLTGLRERMAGAGGSISVRTVSGWSLRAELPPLPQPAQTVDV